MTTGIGREAMAAGRCFGRRRIYNIGGRVRSKLVCAKKTDRYQLDGSVKEPHRDKN